MKTTRESLTNNQVFALRVKADRAGNRELVRTIDRYLEERGDADLQVVLAQLNGDMDRPSVVFMRHPTGEYWRTVELHTVADVERLRGWRSDRIVYIRGVYSEANIANLALIENYLLNEVLAPMRVDGAFVETYLDGPR